MKKKIILTLALTISAAALAYGYKCPIDNTGMWFTGQTTSSYGKLLKKYKCAMGHVSWIVN